METADLFEDGNDDWAGGTEPPSSLRPTAASSSVALCKYPCFLHSLGSFIRREFNFIDSVLFCNQGTRPL